MKVIKHRKYGASPEKPIFTQLLPVFVVDRQTDGQSIRPQEKFPKGQNLRGPGQCLQLYQGPEWRPRPEDSVVTASFLLHTFLVSSLFPLSVLPPSSEPSASRRLGSFGTEERSRVSRPFIPNQPLIIFHTDNSNGPSVSPGDSHLEGGPVRNLPFYDLFCVAFDPSFSSPLFGSPGPTLQITSHLLCLCLQSTWSTSTLINCSIKVCSSSPSFTGLLLIPCGESSTLRTIFHVFFCPQVSDSVFFPSQKRILDFCAPSYPLLISFQCPANLSPQDSRSRPAFCHSPNSCLPFTTCRPLIHCLTASNFFLPVQSVSFFGKSVTVTR